MKNDRIRLSRNALLRLWLSGIALLLSLPVAMPNSQAAAPALLTTVRASTIHPGEYLPENAIDDNLQTRWASLPFAAKPEWIEIDFGKPVSIDRLNIHWEHACATEYNIQTSDNARDWQTAREVKDGKEGKAAFSGLKAKGRYLRLLCLKANSFNLASIWEIEFPDNEPRLALADARRQTLEIRQKARLEAARRLTSLVSEQGVNEIIFSMRQPGRDGHWYANFGYYSHTEAPLYGPGGKLCKLNLSTGALTTLIDDKQGGVRDPVLDYDARKILFSYRKGTNAYYHLYEINLDGSKLKQLTDGEYDDIEPAFLPNDKIVFVSTRCKRWVNCWLTKVANLHVCDADGQNIRAISANLEQDNTPWPMPDGRILYQRWEYVDRSQVDYHHLWTSYPDGSGQMVYYGNLHPGILMIDAKPIPNTDKVIAIFSPGHGQREHDGAVTVIDPRAGPDLKSSARAITTENSYRDPWAFSEELFMAAQARRIVLLDANGNANEIYRVSPQDAAAGLECQEPRPILRRAREPVLTERINTRSATGSLMLADVYKGRNMAGVKRGDIKKLLVLESLPKPVNFTGGMDPLTYGGSFTLERVLGTVPVEADGSAYLELPAMRAVFFVALDENDMAVKRMQSFLSVQPGEVTGCVGCHEQRTEASKPRGGTLATARSPSRIEPILDCPEVYDFPRDVQPILDQLCGDCHGYEKTARGGPYAGKVLLAGDHGPMFSHAYFTMKVSKLYSDNHNRPVSNLPPRSLGSAASRIFKLVDGSHYGVKATEHQRKMLRLWIDVGGPYPGTYGALGNGAVGGYIMNELVNTDFNWPTTRAGADVVDRRCASCHQGNNILPKAMSDERDISFWSFSLDDPRLKLSRHIVFNLTAPEKSLLVLSPLAVTAGGFGLCRDRQGNPASVFKDTADPDYQKLVAMIQAGKQNLDKMKRFDMPGFQPPQQYVREMRHYGVLSPNIPVSALVNPYDLDRKYWESLWYRVPTAQ